MSLIITADAIEQEGGVSVQFPGSTELSLDGSGIRASTGASVLLNTPGTLEISGVGGIRSGTSSNETAAQLFPPSSSNIGISVSGNLSGYVTIPSQPGSLTATVKSSTQIDLVWVSPDSSSDLTFTVERSLNNLDWSPIIKNISSTTYSDTGLTSGLTYYYRVSAINSAGTGLASNPAVDATTWKLSSQPTSLSALTISSTQINLAWSAPLSNGGTPIMSYIVEHSPDNTESSVWTSLAEKSSSERNYSHTSLTGGTVHYYRVKAMNTVGTSDPSTVATTTTWTLPSEPTSLSATVVSPSQIDLQWAAPLSAGGIDISISSYTLEVTTDTSEPKVWSVVVDNTLLTSHLHIGLKAGTVYYYRVKALNVVGVGSTTSVNATTWSVPSLPTAFAATTKSQSWIDLSWSTPESNGGAKIDSYVLMQSTDNSNWTTLQNSSTTSYSSTGLTTGVTYYYQVQAVNVVGAGKPALANASTWTVPSSPVSLTAAAVSDTQIILTWLDSLFDGGTQVSAYTLEVSTDSSVLKQWSPVDLRLAVDNTFYHTGLTPGVTYYYQMKAINVVGSSLPVQASDTTTNSFKATVVSDQQINLEWSPFADSYVLERSQDNLNFFEIATVSSTQTYSDTGLTAGATYYYRIKANNTISSVVSSTTWTVPGTPVMSATQLSFTSVKLSVTPPSENGGTRITGYTLKRFQNNVEEMSTVLSASDSPFTYTDDTVSVNRTYSYELFATNSVGSSKVPATTVMSTDGSAPSKPSLSAAVISETQINLEWAAPLGAQYTLEVSTDANANRVWSMVVENTLATTFSHTTLRASTSYFYRVTAFNIVGTSHPSEVVEAKTSPIQTAPVINTCSANFSDITLQWSEFTYGDSAEISYVVERSSNADSPTPTWTVLAENITTLEYLDVGLVQGTYYSYRVKADIKSVGITEPSGVSGALTWAPPNAPQDLLATVDSLYSATHINLEWSPPNPSLDGTTISQYYVERYNEADEKWHDLATLDSSTYSYSDTGLNANTTYKYRVKAKNEVEKGAPSNKAIVQTTSLVTVQATSVSTTQIDLSWTANYYTDGSDISGFQIERSENNSTWPILVENTFTSLATTTYSDTPVSDSGAITFYYRVSAVDPTNTVGAPSSVVSARLWTIPGTPSILGIPLTYTSIRLFITPPVDDGGSQITGYTLKRSSTNNQQMSFDLSGTDNFFNDNTVTSNQSYTYRLFAINSVGTSQVPATAFVSSLRAEAQPSVVSLEANVVSSTQINLMWTVIDTTPITSYTLERTTDFIVWTTVVNMLNNNNNSLILYSNTSLAPGTGYFYRVVAQDSAGTIHISRSGSGVTWSVPSEPTLSVTDVSLSQINLSWVQPLSNGGRIVTGYRLEQLNNLSNEWTPISTFNDSTTSYSHTGLAPLVMYTYRLFAVNEVGDSAASQVSATTLGSSLDTTGGDKGGGGGGVIAGGI